MLRRRHANFSLIKAEATADDAARLKAMAGPDFMVFNGRGGLDMIACLDGGCDGFLLAPDLADYGARVMRLYDEGRREEALDAAPRGAARHHLHHALARASHLLRQARLRAARRPRGVRPRAGAAAGALRNWRR